MEKAFSQQTKHGIMDDDDDDLLEEQEDDIGSLSSPPPPPPPPPSSSSSEEDMSSNSVGSSSSDSMEDASSSASSSNGPLFEMSSLISQLPLKRGLSRHYEGKSQSFTSLAKSLEDLIKPERPFKKSRQLLESSRSYGWGLDKSLSPKNSITKRSSSKGSLSSLSNMRRHSNNSFSPPYPTPQRSGSLSRQTLLETIG